MVEKKQKTVVNFQPNAPTSVVLDTDPTTAKQGSNVTKNGKTRYFWTYFMSGESVFFADKDLHDKLQGFKRGDAVVITNVVPPGNKWGSYTVEGSGAVKRAVVQSHDAQAEILDNTRKILIILNGKTATQANQNPPVAPSAVPTGQDRLDF